MDGGASEHPWRLTGRRVLVTGASAGIGRAICLRLSQLGARLVLTGRDPVRLEETRGMLPGEGHLAAPFDLARLEDIAPWLKRLAAEHGPLDGLVHSAGAQGLRPLRVLNADYFDELMRVNVGAAAQLARGFRQKGVRRPADAQSGRGAGCSLVFLASVMGLVGQSGVSAYAASKGALVALTRSLALELAPEKIRVNCVAPAFVRTAMLERTRQTMPAEQFAAIEAAHPLGLGEPDDVACGVAYLLADCARWITGTALVIDGGYTAQ